MVEKIGILHPGQMGISVAASAKNSGQEVYWTSEGRSKETRKRAEGQDLHEMRTLDDLCATCSVLVSVCPPHAAADLAEDVVACGFTGIFVDANAISPQKVVRIANMMVDKGITFVDGGIIGGPAWVAGKTWLYLSGEAADQVADFFSSGPLKTEIIGDEIGLASSLKMCFAAYTKGSTALLCGILAASEQLGVRRNLEKQWNRDGSGFAEQTQHRVRQVTKKAWRFTGEMEEIADTLVMAGLPGDFHRAAAEIYSRIAHFKGFSETPALVEILRSLLKDN